MFNISFGGRSRKIPNVSLGAIDHDNKKCCGQYVFSPPKNFNKKNMEPIHIGFPPIHIGFPRPPFPHLLIFEFYWKTLVDAEFTFMNPDCTFYGLKY